MNDATTSAVEYRGVMVEIPVDGDEAAAPFTCPVWKCTIQNGTHCAKRWADGQGGAIELFKCRGCPAGRARAALLGVQPTDYDTFRAVGGMPRHDKSPSARRDRVEEHTRRMKERSMAAQEGRKAVVEAECKRVLAALGKVPNHTLGPKALTVAIHGPQHTSAEYRLVYDATKALAAEGKITKANGGAATLVEKPAVQVTVSTAPIEDAIASIIHAPWPGVTQGDHAAAIAQVLAEVTPEQAEMYNKPIRPGLYATIEINGMSEAVAPEVEGPSGFVWTPDEQDEAQKRISDAEKRIAELEAENAAIRAGHDAHALALHYIVEATGYTPSQWDDPMEAAKGAETHIYRAATSRLALPGRSPEAPPERLDAVIERLNVFAGTAYEAEGTERRRANEVEVECARLRKALGEAGEAPSLSERLNNARFELEQSNDALREVREVVRDCLGYDRPFADDGVREIAALAQGLTRIVAILNIDKGKHDHIADAAVAKVADLRKRDIAFSALKAQILEAVGLEGADPKGDMDPVVLVDVVRKNATLRALTAHGDGVSPRASRFIYRMVAGMCAEARGVLDDAFKARPILCAALDAASAFAREDGTKATADLLGTKLIRVEEETRDQDLVRDLAALADKWEMEARRQRRIASRLRMHLSEVAMRFYEVDSEAYAANFDAEDPPTYPPD